MIYRHRLPLLFQDFRIQCYRFLYVTYSLLFRHALTYAAWETEALGYPISILTRVYYCLPHN